MMLVMLYIVDVYQCSVRKIQPEKKWKRVLEKEKEKETERDRRRKTGRQRKEIDRQGEREIVKESGRKNVSDIPYEEERREPSHCVCGLW